MFCKKFEEQNKDNLINAYIEYIIDKHEKRGGNKAKLKAFWENTSLEDCRIEFNKLGGVYQ